MIYYSAETRGPTKLKIIKNGHSEIRFKERKSVKQLFLNVFEFSKVSKKPETPIKKIDLLPEINTISCSCCCFAHLPQVHNYSSFIKQTIKLSGQLKIRIHNIRTFKLPFKGIWKRLNNELKYKNSNEFVMVSYFLIMKEKSKTTINSGNSRKNAFTLNEFLDKSLTISIS